MKIVVNGNEVQCNSHTLQEFIRERKYGSKIVVERNGKIVKQELWESVELLPGDVLEIVTFVGGG